MFNQISLEQCPGLANLLEGGEQLESLMKMSPEAILLRCFRVGTLSIMICITIILSTNYYLSLYNSNFNPQMGEPPTRVSGSANKNPELYV